MSDKPLLRLACDVTWDSRGICSAWGMPVMTHACRKDQGHTDGKHVCPCGSRSTTTFDKTKEQA